MFVTCLVALLGLFAVACAQGQCGSASYGNTNGEKVPLQDMVMTPGYLSWEDTLPGYVCANRYPNIYHVGSIVSACDYDSPPLVDVDVLLHATVTRTGSLVREGVIHSWVVCSPYNYYGSSEKEGVAKGAQNHSPHVSPVQISARA